jgi:hypothetical protein
LRVGGEWAECGRDLSQNYQTVLLAQKATKLRLQHKNFFAIDFASKVPVC